MLNMLVVEDNIYFSKLLINKTIQFNKNLRLSMIATDGKEVLEIINREKIDIILRKQAYFPKYSAKYMV